jgi:hypothetical protein
MATVTITEALQSIKIVTERVAKKRKEVLSRVAYDSRLQDPLAGKGGSKDYIKAELQAIAALEENVVKTRLAIQQVNFSNTLTINDVERTVAAWLIWRREVAGNREAFYTQVSNQIRTFRQTLAQPTRTSVANAELLAPANAEVNIDERAWAEGHEQIGEILGVLDGRLSAFNATHTIEV